MRVLLVCGAYWLGPRGPSGQETTLATLPGVRIGAHVKAGKGLLPALGHGEEIGAEVIQIHTQSPRMWRASQHTADELRAYREAQSRHPTVAATFCHATYLINLATPDPELTRKSRATLVANLSTAQSMGADGLVLHIGSHRGTGLEAALAKVAEALVEAVEAVEAKGAPDRSQRPCPILLENTAGAGDTIGRSFDELSQVIDAADADDRLGVCLDTQHLWASGISFVTIDESDGARRARRRHGGPRASAVPPPQRLQGRLRRQPRSSPEHRGGDDRNGRVRGVAGPSVAPGASGDPRGSR